MDNIKKFRKYNENNGNINYIAYLTQEKYSWINGDAGDCGCTLLKLNSTNQSDANRELSEIIKEEYFGETALSEAVIYEVHKSVKIDVHAIYNNMNIQFEEERNKKIEHKDREEWERLQRKFNS